MSDSCHTIPPDQMSEVERLTAIIEQSQRERAEASVSSEQLGVAWHNEGKAYFQLAPLREQLRADYEAAVDCFRSARRFLPENHARYGPIFVFEGEALRFLASLRGKPRPDCEAAVECYRAARRFLHENDTYFGHSFAAEGDAIIFLAPLRGQPLADFEAAVDCYRAARRFLPENHPVYGISLDVEGDALQALAPLRGQPQADYEAAIERYRLARRLLPENDENYGADFIVEGDALLALAPLRGQPQADYEAAIECYRSVRLFRPESDPHYGNSFLGESDALRALAPLRGQPQADYEAAVDCCRSVRLFRPENDPHCGDSLLGEGDALRALAPLRGQPQVDYEDAVECFRAARRILPKNDLDCGYSFFREGEALRALAPLRGQPQADYEAAIECYRSVRLFRPESDPHYGNSFLGESDALRALAPLRGQPQADYEAAVDCCRSARRFLPENHATYGFVVEGDALRLLAPLRGQPQADYEAAVECYRSARCFLPKNHANYGNCFVAEGEALRALAPLRGQPQADYEAAVDCYQQGRCSGRAEPDFLLNVARGEAAAREALAAICPEHQAQWLMAAVCYDTTIYLTTNRADLENAQRRYLHCQQSFPWSRAGAHDLLAALQFLRQVSAALDEARVRLPKLQDRAMLFEANARHFSLAVELCLRLANLAETQETAATYHREAWQWSQHGRHRNMIELLARDPAAAPAPTIPATEVIGRELAACEQEIAHVKRDFLAALAIAPIGATEPTARRLQELEQRAGQLRQARSGKSNATPLPRPTPKRTLVTAPLPPQVQVAEACQSLAAPGSRALLLDFMTLDNEETLLFLVPLWKSASIEVHPFPLAQSELLHLLRELKRAVRKIATLRRSRRPARERPLRLTQEQAATQEAEAQNKIQSVLDELGGILSTALTHAMQLSPNELLIAPHFLLNLLPLHALTWQGKPLIDQFPIRYLPSPALATEIIKRPQLPGNEALVVADPSGDQPKRHLPGAALESEMVAAALRKAHIHPDVITHPLATLAQVQQLMPTPTLCHFAAHSTVDRKNFQQSRIELSNREALTVADILELDLPRLSFFYLGSCSGAQMLPGRSDDLMALAQAFFAAGAPAVLASLWELHDGAAAEFAGYFYRFWLGNDAEEGLPLSRAFQKALQALRQHKDYSNPFFWAPFILLGGRR